MCTVSLYFIHSPFYRVCVQILVSRVIHEAKFSLPFSLRRVEVKSLFYLSFLRSGLEIANRIPTRADVERNVVAKRKRVKIASAACRDSRARFVKSTRRSRSSAFGGRKRMFCALLCDVTCGEPPGCSSARRLAALLLHHLVHVNQLFVLPLAFFYFLPPLAVRLSVVDRRKRSLACRAVASSLCFIYLVDERVFGGRFLTIDCNYVYLDRVARYPLKHIPPPLSCLTSCVSLDSICRHRIRSS